MRPDPELAFHNGTVFDGARFLPAGTVVRVRNGSITAVEAGSGAGALAGAEPVDLGGGTLFPGFIDAHVHPVFAGDRMCRCNLAGMVTAAEYAEVIAAYAAAHQDAEWITGGGWSMEAFPGGVPTKDLLDQVTGGRPAFLPNRDGHGAWVNSRALEIAGIDASTPDPPDGRIERDASGHPVGTLQEGAQQLVARLIPATVDRRLVRRAAGGPGVPALARHHRLAGRDRRQPPGTARPDRRLPAGRRRRRAEGQRRRRAVVGAGPRHRAGRRADRAPPGRPGRPVPCDQRQDDAGRRRGEPHGRDARAIPGRPRLRHGDVGPGLHRP